MRSSTIALLQLLVVASLGIVDTALASPSYSGTTNANWTSPVLSGDLIDPVTGARIFTDTTNSAYCSIAGCPNRLTGYPASTIAWGTNTPPEPNPTSIVAFTPANFSDIAPGQDFVLGTLMFTNGTSVGIIFGATLTLGVALTGSAAIVDPIVVHLGVVTTNNTGTARQNADFLDFHSTTFATTQPVTFNVL